MMATARSSPPKNMIGEFVRTLVSSLCRILTDSRELESAGHWLHPFIQHLSKRTGQNVTLLLCGPNGKNQGALEVRRYVSGMLSTFLQF